MFTKPKRNIDIALSAIIFFMIVSCALIVLLQREKGIYSTAKQRAATASEIRQQQAVLSTKTATELDSAFLNEDKVVEFIQTLERASGSFTTFKISFKEDEPEGKTDKYLTFVVDFSGSYRLVHTFIDKLLHAPWIVEVQQLELTSDDNFLGTVSGVLTGRLYVSGEFNQ